MSFAAIIGFVTLVWTVWLFHAALATILKRKRLERRLSTKSQRRLPSAVMLIRPCAGDEPELAYRLASVKYATCSAQLHTVFVVDSLQDAALPAIDIAARQLAQEAFKVTIRIAPHRRINRKVSGLEAAVAVAGEPQPQVIICADSSVDLSGLDLDDMCCQLLEQPRPGIVWSIFTEKASKPLLGNRAVEAILCGSWHSFGLLAAIDPQGSVGKLFAISAQALTDIGGFGAVGRYLGEDMALAQKLIANGNQIEPRLQPVRATLPSLDWKAAVSRFERWIMVIKAQRPFLLLAYPGLLCSTPITLLLGLLSLMLGWWPAFFILVLSVITRLIVAIAARRAMQCEFDRYTIMVDAILGDVTLLVSFIRAAFRKSVRWRGISFRFNQQGKLREDERTKYSAR